MLEGCCLIGADFGPGFISDFAAVRGSKVEPGFVLVSHRHIDPTPDAQSGQAANPISAPPALNSNGVFVSWPGCLRLNGIPQDGVAGSHPRICGSGGTRVNWEWWFLIHNHSQVAAIRANGGQPQASAERPSATPDFRAMNPPARLVRPDATPEAVSPAFKQDRISETEGRAGMMAAGQGNGQ